MNKIREILFLIILSAVAVVATSRASLALTIDFIGTYGGFIGYSGGPTPLTGTGLPIFSVLSIPPGFSATTLIQGGSMSFTTGAYSGPSASGGYTFGTGGSLSITGGVSAFGIAPASTLMQATFATSPVFKYLRWSAGALSAGLSIGYLNPIMLAAFSVPPVGTGTGALTQLNIFMNPASLPFGGGVGFTAQQFGAAVTSTPLAVPEPASLLLLGSGLTVLGLIGIGRSRLKEPDGTDTTSRLI